nr:MAG TPA: replisome organizer [Caudoviricetes sp.]
MRLEGGYIILSKKILDSDIYRKPPLYLKVWIYILSKANFTDGKKLKRGQVFLSIPELQEACSYYVGYRKETPTKKQISGVLDWLRNPGEGSDECDTNGPMIETTKVTRGMVVTIRNYDIYQDFKSYEGTTESNIEVPAKVERRSSGGDTITKGSIKKDKKENVKHVYGAYKHVRLKDSEREELATQYGEEMAKRAITFLDEYIEMKGYKAKSHYLCIRKWVVDAVKERERKAKPVAKKTNQFHNFEERDYNYDELEKQLFERQMGG